MLNEPNQAIETIKKFKQYNFLHWTFLNVYYFALYLSLAAKNYYGALNVPSTINVVIWIIAGIGFFPFILVLCMLIIQTKTIQTYLREHVVEKKFRNFSIILFMLSMIPWLVTDIPLWISITYLVLLTIFLEFNARNNKQTLEALLQKVQ